MIALRGLGGAWLEIPVTPDAPEARRWLREELAKAPYDAARPTWFDRLSQAILDWFSSLTFVGDGGGGWVPVVVTLVVVALLVAAILIFGLPRRTRRRRQPAGLFAADEHRSADQMRRAAATAAAALDWTLAGEEAFRALAQGLAERTIVRPTPGTTAHSVAELAAAAFPAERARLREAAGLFEGVRYLGAAGTERDYRTVLALDTDLAAARPLSAELPAPVAG